VRSPRSLNPKFFASASGATKKEFLESRLLGAMAKTRPLFSLELAVNQALGSIQLSTVSTDVELAAPNLAIVISEKVRWLWAQSILGAQASRVA